VCQRHRAAQQPAVDRRRRVCELAGAPHRSRGCRVVEAIRGSPRENIRAAGTPPPPAELLKEPRPFEGVGRDLRESPFSFDLDVHDVADGTYLLVANAGDGTKPLGATIVVVRLRKGL